jgi:hypothetical protein
MTGLGLRPLDREPPGGPAAQPVDGLTRLRRHHQRLLGDQERNFPIPGYDGDLVARYRRMDLETYRAALDGPADGLLERNVQFLIDACTAIYERVDGELQLLSTEPLVTPWASAILAVLGPEDAPTEARDMVLAVFAGHELAIADHAGDVATWMESVKAAADDALAGG